MGYEVLFSQVFHNFVPNSGFLIWAECCASQSILSSALIHNDIGRPCFSVLYLTVFHRFYCTVYRVKVCGNPALSKSIGVIFPRAFAHSLSLHHIMVTLTIIRIFSLLLYVMVIHDQWCVMLPLYFFFFSIFQRQSILKLRCVHLGIMLLHTS